MDKLLHPEVQQFIKTNADSDITKLLLKGGDVAGVPISQLADQIVSRNKSKIKIPFLYEQEGVIFPPKLSMEQCSSEKTADYKANLVKGKHGADLTGGAGVDSYFLSQNFDQFDYIEQNENLALLTKHNFSQLNAHNINTHNCSAEQFLEHSQINYDLLYLDPARRGDNNRKVFMFVDCTPNVIDLKKTLFEKARLIMVKASPLVDIKLGIEELGNVKELHVVAVNNECKELLFLLEENYKDDTKIIAANEKNGWNTFEFLFNKEILETPNYSLPQNYLYEPNVALLKAGAYKSVGTKFGVNKLHPNSHLYTSEKRVEKFPGRVFEISQILKYDKKTLIKEIPSKKANITCRNFPESVQQIRKKTGLKEGGDVHLYATTDLNNNKIIILSKRL